MFKLKSSTAVAALLGCVSLVAVAEDDGFTLDHRYRPGKWQTAIGLPDDWQKSLVDRSGELLYDYPGSFEGFATRIDVELSDGSGEWIGQALEAPRVPVVQTRRRWGQVEMLTEAFAVTDLSANPLEELKTAGKPAVEHSMIPLSSHDTNFTFAAPESTVDKEFASTDVGWGQPLRYRFVGQRGVVVFGFCEGHWNEFGQRVMELRIDGVVKRAIDTVRDAGKNVAFIVPVEAEDTNGDGRIDIEVAAAGIAKDHNTILSALWVFDQMPPAKDVVAGRATETALAYLPSGASIPPKFTGPPRADLMVVTLRNTSTDSKTVHPRIRVRSSHKLGWDKATGTVSIRDWRMVNSSLPPAAMAEEPRTMLLDLPPVVLKGNSARSFVVSIHSNANGRVWSVEEARKAIATARSYWNKLDLPYGVIRVPDAAVQAQLDAAIRNIYQAREIKDGLPSFQVGPTVYRGLWIVDGAFLLESITHLNRAEETRAGVQHMLTYQNEDGSFEKIGRFWKENGIILWVISRHAQLTGDDQWLESVWPVVERVMTYYPVLRERSRQDPNAPSYDFIPLGYSDGGLNVDHEYTNAYWLLIGLKEAVSMAEQLGRPDQAQAWQREYDELWARYRTLAKRDMVTDEFGNRMLPIPMSRPLKTKLQKGQWAFMHAVYPGLIFEQDDPILLGTLANLAANRCEGLVLGTGWDEEGLWGYAGSFFAHAQLAAGDGVEAARTAYAFANHASPLLAWREEQRPLDHPHPHYVGDMPHNWASAEFIRLILHLIVFERGDELHLFEGLPPVWLRPGAGLKIDRALTRFGEVSLTLQVADDGQTATLDVTPPTRTPASKLVVHAGKWLAEVDGKDIAKGALVEIPADRPSHLLLTLQ